MNKDKLIYCGLGVYVDIESGKLFEKKASGDMDEIRDVKLSAEQRFVNRNIDNDELLNSEVIFNE